MIDWLLRHPVAIVVIVMVVSALFRQKKAANAKASTFAPTPGERPDEQPKPVPGFDDNDDDFGVGSSSEAERAQRLQEEIRRKIAERRGQSVPTAATARAGDPFEVPPASVMSPQAMAAQAKREENVSPFQRRETPAFTSASARPPASAAAQASEVDAVLEQQRLLAEKLDALNAARRAAADVGSFPAGAAAQASTFPATASSAADVGGAGWLRELRNARSLRKAIVLREVVGPPVALR